MRCTKTAIWVKLSVRALGPKAPKLAEGPQLGAITLREREITHPHPDCPCNHSTGEALVLIYE